MRSSGLISFAVVAAALVGCASASKTWKANNTLAMTECSVAFSRSTQGSAFSNQFSNKGISNRMVVLTPFSEYPEAFQEIAEESCARLEKKLVGLGFTVVTGTDLAAKSEKYTDLQKDFTKEPDIREQLAYYPYSKTGVPKGGSGFSVSMGYAKIARSNAGIVIAPSISVGFGSIRGSGSSVTDANQMTTSTTTTKYNPLITIIRDHSGLAWMAGDMADRFEVKKDLKDDSVAWLTNVKKGDTKHDALSAVGSVLLGSRANSTTYFTMEVDATAMKQAILAQLDKAEDEYIAQIQKLKK